MPSPDETLWYDYTKPGTEITYVVMIVPGSFESGNKPYGCVDVYVVGSNPKRVFGGVNAMADLRNGRPPQAAGRSTATKPTADQPSPSDQTAKDMLAGSGQ